MKFKDFNELGEQIKRDAETAREYFVKHS